MGFDDRIAECAEQDQTAHTCRLILVYALSKIDLWSRVKDKGLSITGILGS